MGKKIKSQKYALAIGGAKGVIRILVYVFILLIICWLGKTAYGFGYEVFNQKPVDDELSAKSVTVTITEDMSVYQIGEVLQKGGLVEKPLVFWMQEKISDFSGKLLPGTYELTTAQDIDAMLRTMSQMDEVEEG